MKYFTLFLFMALVSPVRAEEPAMLIPVDPEKPRVEFNFTPLESLGVQSGGRVKPLLTWAKENALLITGKTHWVRAGASFRAIDLMFSWLAHPGAWENEPFVLVNREDVKKQLGLPVGRNHFSPKELFQESYLKNYAESVGRGNQSVPIAKTAKADPREVELKRIYERLNAYSQILSGEAWALFYVPGAVAYQTLEDLKNKPDAAARLNFLKLVVSYSLRNKAAFFDASKSFAASLAPGPTPPVKLKLEVWTQKFDPYRLAWIFYLLGVLVFALGRWVSKRPHAASLGFWGVGFFFHVGGVISRSYIAGRPPVTNMYESVVWVAFGTLVFSFIIYRQFKSFLVLSVGATLAFLALLVADSAPVIMDPALQPLVPVLRSNLWLTIHVLTITISYAAFALSFGVSQVSLSHYFRGTFARSDARSKMLQLQNMNYRAMQMGVVLLALGTILGGIWADYSWGRFWGWDPKEVWALIALLGYLAILHARFTAWIKPFGFAVWSAVAFSLVIMAWYGVNFVLGVGLHSYGFSQGGQGYVAFFVGLELLYILATVYRVKKLPVGK